MNTNIKALVQITVVSALVRLYDGVLAMGCNTL